MSFINDDQVKNAQPKSDNGFKALTERVLASIILGIKWVGPAHFR
jgi:hypothetical protein